MRIRLSELRRLIREEFLLVEGQMSDPIALAVGNALVNHMKSPAFASEVQKGLNGKKGDPNRASDELIAQTGIREWGPFRESIYAAVRAASGDESAVTLGAPKQQQQAAQPAPKNVQQPSA